jgi:LPS O-antigen subunit length determinant protein (WzzB/FepE family)
VIDWDLVGKAISAALTLLFAGVVAYVAVQQWKLNERLEKVSQEQLKVNSRQYRLSLYEKRLAIYNATFARLAEVLDNTNSSFQDNVKFIRATRDNEFLFGQEVADFINNIWTKGNELWAHQQVGGTAQRQAEIIAWFDAQRAEARNVFKKYIDFTEAI